jgi:hypothetical protein
MYDSADILPAKAGEQPVVSSSGVKWLYEALDDTRTMHLVSVPQLA